MKANKKVSHKTIDEKQVKKDVSVLETAIRAVIDNDLPWERVQVLMTLSGKQELVKYCIERYENEFNLKAPILGDHSAGLAAWDDVMSVLQYSNYIP